MLAEPEKPNSPDQLVRRLEQARTGHCEQQRPKA